MIEVSFNVKLYNLGLKSTCNKHANYVVMFTTKILRYEALEEKVPRKVVPSYLRIEIGIFNVTMESLG